MCGALGRAQVGPSSLDALNWNQLVVGLERFDVRRKRALRDGGPQGTDLLLDRLMTARASRSAELTCSNKSACAPCSTARATTIFASASFTVAGTVSESWPCAPILTEKP